MNNVERDIIDGLEDFLAKLKSGEPVEAARVQLFDTPDGPMHIRADVVLVVNDGETTP